MADGSSRASSVQTDDTDWGNVDLPVFSSILVAPTQDDSRVEVNWEEDSDAAETGDANEEESDDAESSDESDDDAAQSDAEEEEHEEQDDEVSEPASTTSPEPEEEAPAPVLAVEPPRNKRKGVAEPTAVEQSSQRTPETTVDIPRQGHLGSKRAAKQAPSEFVEESAAEPAVEPAPRSRNKRTKRGTDREEPQVAVPPEVAPEEEGAPEQNGGRAVQLFILFFG
jgi:exosome complex component RRP41